MDGYADSPAGDVPDDAGRTSDHQVRFGSGTLDRAKDAITQAYAELLSCNKQEAQAARQHLERAAQYLLEELPS